MKRGLCCWETLLSILKRKPLLNNNIYLFIGSICIWPLFPCWRNQKIWDTNIRHKGVLRNSSPLAGIYRWLSERSKDGKHNSWFVWHGLTKAMYPIIKSYGLELTNFLFLANLINHIYVCVCMCVNVCVYAHIGILHVICFFWKLVMIYRVPSTIYSMSSNLLVDNSCNYVNSEFCSQAIEFYKYAQHFFTCVS